MTPFLAGFLAALIGLGSIFILFAPVFIAACLENNLKVPEWLLSWWLVASVQLLWLATCAGLAVQFMASHGGLQ